MAKYENYKTTDTNCIVKVNNGKKYSHKVIAKRESFGCCRRGDNACFDFYDTKTNHNYEVWLSKENLEKMLKAFGTKSSK